MRAHAAGLRHQPGRLLDRRRAGPEELLGGAGRPGARPRVTSAARSAPSSAGTCPGRVSCAPGPPRCPTAPGATSPSTSATPGRSWCSSPTAATAARAWPSARPPMPAEWEALVDAALAPGGERWVAQRLVAASRVPVPGDGRRRPAPRRALLRRVRLRPQCVRPGHPRTRVAEPGRQRRPCAAACACSWWGIPPDRSCCSGRAARTGLPRSRLGGQHPLMAVEEVAQPGRGDRFDENRIGLDHLSFGVASRVDLEHAVRRPGQAGPAALRRSGISGRPSGSTC